MRTLNAVDLLSYPCATVEEAIWAELGRLSYEQNNDNVLDTAHFRLPWQKVNSLWNRYHKK